jgi:hypothetical protein
MLGFRIPLRALRRAVAAAPVALLAACGNVSAGVDFAAPKDWTATPALFGRAQMWLKNGSDKQHRQVVMLIRADPNGRDVFYDPKFAEGSVEHLKREKITICGDREAELVSGRGGNGQTSAMEGVTTRIGDTQFAAMYLRKDARDPTDPEAERAIRSLCPKP